METLGTCLTPVCTACKASYANDGIEIKNRCLENLPQSIYICGKCAMNTAVAFMTGDISIASLGKILKGLRK